VQGLLGIFSLLYSYRFTLITVSVSLISIMVVQFCEDCGNLLEESAQDLVTCVVCRKVAKSKDILSVALEKNH
jgi:hypothetical protein